MKEVPYKELVVGKEYIIAHKELFHDYDSFYKGLFCEQYQFYQHNPTITFRDIRGKSKHGTSYTNYWNYTDRDTFYDIDSIDALVHEDVKYLIDVKLQF